MRRSPADIAEVLDTPQEVYEHAAQPKSRTRRLREEFELPLPVDTEIPDWDLSRGE